ncbi:MAG: nucleotidyltransferase domain-containing protein [Methanoregula sp.]|nr:nucleotidyltransferase domain-containing protein [Methanoregula sp.]
MRELQVFGSVLRNDFCPDSDIDIIVDFKHGSVHILIHLAKMEKNPFLKRYVLPANPLHADTNS